MLDPRLSRTPPRARTYSILRHPPLRSPGGPRNQWNTYRKNTYATDSEKCLYASEPGSKVKPTKNKKHDNFTKKRDINSDSYLLYFNNIWLSKVTQNPSIIVKENATQNNLTFNARQPTNVLKRASLWFPFLFKFRICSQLWP